MTRPQQSKRHITKPTMSPETLTALKALDTAQKQLRRLEQLKRQGEIARRQAVTTAWKTGASAREIACVLEISLAATYKLLPVRRPRS